MYFWLQWSCQGTSESKKDAVNRSLMGVTNDLLVCAILKNCEKCLSVLHRAESNFFELRLLSNQQFKTPQIFIQCHVQSKISEKQQIITLKKLEQANVWHFFFEKQSHYSCSSWDSRQPICKDINENKKILCKSAKFVIDSGLSVLLWKRTRLMPLTQKCLKFSFGGACPPDTPKRSRVLPP